jgi:hypothetical protein
MRHTLVVFLVLALMIPAQSFAAVPAYDDGPADETAATSSQQTEPVKKKYKETKKEKKKKKGEIENRAVPTDSLEVDEDDVGFFMTIVGGFFFAVAIGSVGSWYRVTGQPTDWDLEGNWGQRETGEPGIPYAALNFSYEGVRFSDVDAFDGRFEGGYGPFGVNYRFTRFEEKDPDTRLDLSWLHGVLRQSYTRYVEVGFAFGAVFLDGNTDESGFSFAIPIRVAPVSFASLEYRPTWGWINESSISDEDLALCVGVRYVSLRAGYRWTKVPGLTLEGPTVGVLLSW